MKIVVESVTGGEYEVTASETECIRTLKRRIWRTHGILPYHQALIHHGRVLGDEATIAESGIQYGTRLQLVLITRAGPFSLPFQASSITAAVAEQREQSLAEASEVTEGDMGVSCDTSPAGHSYWSEEMMVDAKRRAEENCRTKARMREIQENLEQLRIEKRKRFPAADPEMTGGLESGRRRLVSGSAKSRSEPRPSRISAPEDTSAKESSAGETEFEDWDAADALASRDAVDVSETEAREECGASRWVPSRERQRSRRQLRPGSSSSELEDSSGLLCTGSEDEDAQLVTADEGRVFTVEEAEEFFSGVSDCVQVAIPPATPTDASEMSSGMIICDLALDLRRAKIQRKRYQMGKVLSRRPEACAAKKVLRGQTPSTRCRPKSKPRHPLVSLLTTTPGVKRWSTTGESSSDDLAHLPSTSASTVARKSVVSHTSRPFKYRTQAGQTDNSVVRNHKLPQSSQSQQRCNACGFRLSFSTTFQCRCGKALCARHRPPVSHTCSYDAGRIRLTAKSHELSE